MSCRPALRISQVLQSNRSATRIAAQGFPPELQWTKAPLPPCTPDAQERRLLLSLAQALAVTAEDRPIAV